MFPPVDAIAKALARRDSTRLQPSGAYAANLLGLSDQGPMKVVFLTDGPSKRVQIGNQEIILKKTTPRNMATAGNLSGLVIQALRYLGRDQVDLGMIQVLKTRVGPAEMVALQKDLGFAPAWIAGFLRAEASEEGTRER
ncbi:MAG: DUF6088 family protein [Spirochaetota bacterium]